MGAGLQRAFAAARAPQPLTDKQKAILRYLNTQPDGATANWIAEGCGHFYQTSWASSAMPTLVKRGLVNSPSRGWYVLTKAGLVASLA